MIYFSTSKSNASLDEVLAGAVSTAPPVAGSYMSEDKFGTVVTVGGQSTTSMAYTSFNGIKGKNYYDTFNRYVSKAALATLTISSGYYVAGGYIWYNGVRRSDRLPMGEDVRPIVYAPSDSSGKSLEYAYGPWGTYSQFTTQLFTGANLPLNGTLMLAPGLLAIYLNGHMLLSGPPQDYRCYNANLELVAGDVSSDDGHLVVPAGTLYVKADNGGVCVVDGSQVKPVPLGVDLSSIGVQVVTSAGLSTQSGSGAASPSTFSGPWYEANGQPAKGGVGDYYFDLQGFSSYQPAAPYMALISPTFGVLYAPSSVHFANMLPIPANTGTPFLANAEGKVGVRSGASYVLAEQITVGSTVTYADSAAAPTLVLLLDGSYPIGTVKGYRVTSSTSTALTVTSSFSWWLLLVLLVVLLGVVICSIAIYHHVHKAQ